ncbi:hypothetical protein [Dongia deserti]|uniref:hypothetical protein n=1 Tax=Dongia deserti TaxID=2268030 RepID=UPI000E64774E|nr:hypothetical protein [Dongia deserti]
MLNTTPDPIQLTGFRELIARWPTTRAFARDAGCSPTLVRQWRHRDFVPAHYWPRIVNGAAKRGIPLINASLLAELAAKRRALAKAVAT